MITTADFHRAQCKPEGYGEHLHTEWGTKFSKSKTYQLVSFLPTEIISIVLSFPQQKYSTF